MKRAALIPGLQSQKSRVDIHKKTRLRWQERSQKSKEWGWHWQENWHWQGNQVKATRGKKHPGYPLFNWCKACHLPRLFLNKCLKKKDMIHCYCMLYMLAPLSFIIIRHWRLGWNEVWHAESQKLKMLLLSFIPHIYNLLCIIPCSWKLWISSLKNHQMLAWNYIFWWSQKQDLAVKRFFFR